MLTLGCTGWTERSPAIEPQQLWALRPILRSTTAADRAGSYADALRLSALQDTVLDTQLGMNRQKNNKTTVKRLPDIRF